MLIFRKLPTFRYSLALCLGVSLFLALLSHRASAAASRRALYSMGSLSMTCPLVRRRKTKSRSAAPEASAEGAAALQQGRIFHQISEMLPDLLYIYDLTEQRNIYVNREIGAMLNYTPTEIQAMGSGLFARLIHPDDLENVAASQLKIASLAEGETLEIEYRMRRKDGEWRWLCSRDLVFKRDAVGKPTQTLGIAQDITERRKAQEAAQWQAALLRHTTDAATLGFYVADSETDAVLYYNTRFMELWNLVELAPRLQTGKITHSELIAHCLLQIENAGGDEAGWEPMQNDAGGDAAGEEIRLTNGRVLRRAATPIQSETTACFGRFYWFEEITAHCLLQEQLETELAYAQESRVELEMKTHLLNQANAELERLATTDGLTGLQNNRSFREFLSRTLAQSKRGGGGLSLIMLDVDRFKQYNDSFGHPAGDEVLKQVARVLQSVTRETDCAARYGGEEFILILPETDVAGAMLLAERLRAALGRQEWQNRLITASFGVTTQTQVDADAAALIAQADRALYEAKHRGRDCAVHTLELPPERDQIALAA